MTARLAGVTVFFSRENGPRLGIGAFLVEKVPLPTVEKKNKKQLFPKSRASRWPRAKEVTGFMEEDRHFGGRGHRWNGKSRQAFPLFHFRNRHACGPRCGAFVC